MTDTSTDITRHKELYPGRIETDTTHTRTLISYYSLHNPFRPPCVLRNISTGVHAPSAVNIMKCKSIGENILSTMLGKSAQEITFAKSVCAVGMNGNSSTGNVNHNKMAPQKLFQRLVSTSAKLKMDTAHIVGTYELTSFPTSLFKSSHIMHRPNKPDFKSIYDNFLDSRLILIYRTLYMYLMVVILFIVFHGQEDRQSSK